jgi:thiamine monophosphate kinase
MGSGVGRAVVDAIFADLAAAAPRALDEVASTLPPDFPAKLFDQIASGIRRRLRTIGAAA